MKMILYNDVGVACSNMGQTRSSLILRRATLVGFLQSPLLPSTLHYKLPNLVYRANNIMSMGIDRSLKGGHDLWYLALRENKCGQVSIRRHTTVSCRRSAESSARCQVVSPVPVVIWINFSLRLYAFPQSLYWCRIQTFQISEVFLKALHQCGHHLTSMVLNLTQTHREIILSYVYWYMLLDSYGEMQS
jgi:hypothetical protein